MSTKENSKEVKQGESLPVNKTLPFVEGGNLHFEEWECRRVLNRANGKVVVQFEKLEKIRPCVKITANEAQTIHDGLVNGDNKFVFMYLLPGQIQTFAADEINYIPL